MFLLRLHEPTIESVTLVNDKVLEKVTPESCDIWLAVLGEFLKLRLKTAHAILAV